PPGRRYAGPITPARMPDPDEHCPKSRGRSEAAAPASARLPTWSAPWHRNWPIGGDLLDGGTDAPGCNRSPPEITHFGAAAVAGPAPAPAIAWHGDGRQWHHWCGPCRNRDALTHARNGRPPPGNPAVAAPARPVAPRPVALAGSFPAPGRSV